MKNSLKHNDKEEIFFDDDYPLVELFKPQIIKVDLSPIISLFSLLDDLFGDIGNEN